MADQWYQTESGKRVRAICIPELEFADDPERFEEIPLWFRDGIIELDIRPVFASNKWGYSVDAAGGRQSLNAGQYLVCSDSGYYQILSSERFHREYKLVEDHRASTESPEDSTPVAFTRAQ